MELTRSSRYLYESKPFANTLFGHFLKDCEEKFHRVSDSEQNPVECDPLPFSS